MNLSPPSILYAVFFSLSPPICLPAPTHSVALILPLDKVVSRVPLFAFRSPGQSVVLGCVGGIIPFLLFSWPWLLPPWTSQVLVSQRGGQILVSLQNSVIRRTTCELVCGGTPAGPADHSGAGFTSSTPVSLNWMKNSDELGKKYQSQGEE